MSRGGWLSATVDAAAVCAAVGVLVAIGRRPFGDEPLGVGTPLSLLLVWVATGAAACAVAAAAGGRRPPSPTWAGTTALALVIGGLAAVDTASTVKILAVAAAAAFPFACATFTHATLSSSLGAAGRTLLFATILAVAARVVLREPFGELRCSPYCRDNPLLLDARPGLVLLADRIVGIATLVWAAVTVARMGRSASSWSRVSATLAVVAACLAAAISLARPGQSVWSAPTTLLPALVPAVLVAAFALASHRDVQSWRTRAAVRRLASDLAGGIHGGGSSEQLRRVVGDESVRLLFPARESGTYLDREGRWVEPDAGLSSTTVERDGQAIALIEHDVASRGLVDAALTPAVAVAIENERLHAIAQAELDELRTSRRRIVERSDETRRRLERDLHDGAQQRLLLLGIELSRAAAATGDDGERERYEAAVAHTQRALTELRELVHEQLPPVLDELGLSEALRSLAETSALPLVLELDGMPVARPPLAVERVVYGLVLAVLGDAQRQGASKLTITIGRPASPLTATIRHDATAVLDPNDVEDRVGAVGGSLAVTEAPGATTYEASFP